MRPAISVIITEYWPRNFLKYAVKSVSNQTLNKGLYELIVVKRFRNPEIDRLIESHGGKVIMFFRHHRYSPLEKLYSVILFIAGLSLRDVSERFCLTFASRESVRIWAHRPSSLFRPSKRVRRLVAVDETVLKTNGRICYLWAAIDVDTGEILALYASRGRGLPNAIKFLKMVLRSCDGKPIVVVDRGPWYRWAWE
jgi:transposase-like protein